MATALINNFPITFQIFPDKEYFLGTFIFHSSLIVYPDMLASLAKQGLNNLQNSRMHLPNNKLHGC